MVSPGDIKVKHVGRPPEASILVYDKIPPYPGLEVRGHARILSAKPTPSPISRRLGHPGTKKVPAELKTD